MKNFAFFMGVLLTSLLMFSCSSNEELNGVVSQSEKKNLRSVYARSSEYPRAPTASEEDQLRDWFPKLDMSKVMITGPATKVYNCVAWALGIDYKWINFPSFLGEFEYLFENAKALEGAPYNFTVVSALSNGADVDGWGLNSSDMTHASVFYQTGYYESKIGNAWRITHDREGLSWYMGSGSYGDVVTSFNKSFFLYDSKEEFARKRELAMQKLSPVEISPEKKNALFVKNRNNSNGNFEKVFAAWVDRWMSPKSAPSSRLEDAKDLPEFSQLLAMGTKILPLVVEKMLDDENLLAVVLYDALQDNKELKVMYVGDEYLKGEQYRMQLSAKKWIDSNL